MKLIEKTRCPSCFRGCGGSLCPPVAVKEFFPGSTVFHKNDVSTNVAYINKSMIPHYSHSKARFLRKAAALVRFKDVPEGVDILDFSEENNTAYIIMEYVRGIRFVGTPLRGVRGPPVTVLPTF